MSVAFITSLSYTLQAKSPFISYIRPRRFFFLCFASGARMILGLASKKKKIRHTYNIHVCCDILWFEVLVLGAQQRHASSSQTTLSTLCIATCVAHVTAHRPAFRLVQGTKLVYMYSRQHLFHCCCCFFFFFFFFSFFRTPSLLLAG